MPARAAGSACRRERRGCPRPRRRSLGVVDVEARARDALLAQRRDERRLVHDRTARGVDEISGGLHQRQLLRADQAACARPQDHVDGHDVGRPEQLLLGSGLIDAGLLAALGGEVLAPGDDLHAHRLGDLGHPGAKPAEPDHAERLALDVGAERALPEGAPLHALALLADMAGEFQHQADGDGRGRAADGGGAAGDDAALARRHDVEHPVARAGRDDQAQIGQRLDQFPWKAGPLAREHDHVEAGKRARDLLDAAERPVEHGELDLAGEALPVGHLEGDVLVVVEDRAAMEVLGLWHRIGPVGRRGGSGGKANAALTNAKPRSTARRLARTVRHSRFPPPLAGEGQGGGSLRLL